VLNTAADQGVVTLLRGAVDHGHQHNTRRRHSALGMLSPTEYKDLHRATQAA
jgi:transposase InsO family protein